MSLLWNCCDGMEQAYYWNYVYGVFGDEEYAPYPCAYPIWGRLFEDDDQLFEIMELFYKPFRKAIREKSIPAPAKMIDCQE